MGYQLGFFLKLLVLRTIESSACLPALTFRGQCRNVGTDAGSSQTSISTSALVDDPRTGNGHRVYSCGVGGSPIGAQANFVHFRRIEPFLTSGGGFLYFNHRMFGQTHFNFTAQLGGGLQLCTSNRHAALDLGYKYHHISNANLGARNPGMDSHMLFVGVSLLR